MNILNSCVILKKIYDIGMGDMPNDDGAKSETSTEIAVSWNNAEETLLKSISERANCMRWMHNQCQLHFESMNFYLTIPNVIISTLNGSFTMSLTTLFTTTDSQKIATTIIGLISIFSAVLTTMNQYVKSQQMMEAHRMASLSQSKLHRLICNQLSLRRDKRMNAGDFLKTVMTEQDRLESVSPTILEYIILKFNKEFSDKKMERPVIAGDLDETLINLDAIDTKPFLEDLKSDIPSINTLVKPQIVKNQ
jgi:hypothetical protein